MKKIFAGIVLPTLAALAVIGSGFSVYFFGENKTSISSNGSIKVENLLRVGDLTTSTTSADLHLDQTADVRAAILDKTNGYVNSTGTANTNVDGKSNYETVTYGNKANAKGIYLTSTSEKFEITYTNPNSTNNQQHDYVEGAAKLQIVTTFTLDANVAKYIGLDTTATEKGTWDESKASTGIYKFTWNTETTGDKNYTMTLPLNNSTEGAATADSNFKFVYRAYTNQYAASVVDANRTGTTVDALKTAEPHTDAEYAAMLAEVKDKSLKIETVATIIAA